MDELDPSSNPSENPEEIPFPDFNPEPVRSHPIGKIVVLLVVLGGVAAFVFLGGARRVMDWYASQPDMYQNMGKMQQLKSETSFAALAFPGSIRLIGAYHAPMNDKGINIFLAAPETDPRVLPKEFDAALQLAAHKGPVYYLVSVKNAASAIDQVLKKIADIIRQQGSTTHLQNKIWVADKEIPATIDEVVKGDQVFQLVVLRLSDTAGFLAITPSSQIDQSFNRDMVGTLMHAQSSTVFFAPPEPAGMKWARGVISSDVTERKKAVPMLANLGGAQPEAVAFLADAMPKLAPDVKIDVIAALGLLAPSTPQAIQPLIVELKDKETRTEAMAALGSLGPSASAAVPTLKKIALNKKEPKAVRAAANTALMKITGRSTVTTVPASKRKKKHHR